MTNVIAKSHTARWRTKLVITRIDLFRVKSRRESEREREREKYRVKNSMVNGWLSALFISDYCLIRNIEETLASFKLNFPPSATVWDSLTLECRRKKLAAEDVTAFAQTNIPTNIWEIHAMEFQGRNRWRMERDATAFKKHRNFIFEIIPMSKITKYHWLVLNRDKF